MKNIFYKTIRCTLCSILLFASCNEKENSNKELVAYPVIAVESRDIMAYQTFPASLQGTNNNDVRAKIQGYISEVLVDEGQRVKKGQIMFRLETNSLSQNASAAKAGIAAAQAKVEAAKVEVNRLKPLVEQNIISAVLLETANANLLQAKSGLEQAKANHNSIVADVNYSAIRAPIDGVVGKINLRTGALAGASDQMPITTVSDVWELYAYFSMNEAEYLNFLHEAEGNSQEEKLRNLPQVELVMANGRMYEEKGKITAVTGQINPQTGSIQFRVSFPNKQGLLTNGSSGVIRVPKLFKSVLVIPETSIFEQQNKIFAYVVKSDTVRMVEIQQKDRVDNLVLIESGLKQGEIVAADGVAKLRPNTAIRPQKTTTDSIIKNIQPIF